MLVFDVELLSAFAAAPRRPRREGGAGDAKKTPWGLAYSVLKTGTGKRRPDATAVTVNYSGMDHRRQDVRQLGDRGGPATFPLNGVITGWTEGVALMVDGDVTRFWIPENLTTGAEPPFGLLVFDVELIRIQ